MSNKLLVQSLSQLIDSVRTRSDAEFVEIEVRVAVSETEFLKRFAACTRMLEFCPPRLAETMTVAQSLNQGKRRSEYCASGRCLLESVTKTRIRAIDFGCIDGRLRVDAQIETPCSAVVSASPGTYVRLKQRLSFTFADIAGWRIDFTRVNDGNTDTHEIEIECTQVVSDRPAIELAQEATRVLDRLHIFIR